MNFNSINFIIFSHNNKIPRETTFDKPFINEGIVLGLCIKGSAKIKVDLKEYDLFSNTVLILLPGRTTELVEKSVDSLIETIYISKDFIIDLPLPKEFKFALTRMDKPCFSVNKLVMQDLLDYYYFIEKQNLKFNNSYYNDFKIKGIIFSMIIEILSIYNSNSLDNLHSSSSRKEEIADNFFKELYSSSGKERSVKFYSDKLYVSSKYLSSIIKEITGHSVLSWIHEVFILEAKNQLKNTNKTILQLSDEFNISNPSFFCRIFKKYTGMSPLEYRNENIHSGQKLYLTNQ